MLSKTLVWFPQMKACVSEQAFPLSPGMCLLWSLHTQTGENNFGNCSLNWQAWISRRHLRVLSCQVAPRFLAAPESHYSQDGHCARLSFSSHCAQSPPPPPTGFNHLDCEEGRRHTCSHLAVSQEGFFVCVRVCLQTLFAPPAHGWPSASGAWGVPQGSSQDGAVGLWQGTWAKNFSAGWGWNCLLKLEIKIMKPQDHRNPRIVDLKGTVENI